MSTHANTQSNASDHYDVIIIGSGTCGATIANELSQQNKRILMLEQGDTLPIKESFMGFASMARMVPVADKLQAPRGIATGGSTGIYFGVANDPPLDTFRLKGIDLSAELTEVKQALPIATLPDALMSEQSIRLSTSARELGLDWQKNQMLVDQSQCQDGYNNDARWRARDFVEQAVARGTQLETKASVTRIITDANKAIGVEYRQKKNAFFSKTYHAYGSKIILAAGGLATPKMLRDHGIDSVASEGFYCDPGYGYFGIVPGMQGSSNFVGNGFCRINEDIDLGDGNMSPLFHKLLMFSKFKFKHYSRFHETIGIGVKVHDDLGGSMKPNGKLYKSLTDKDMANLKHGEAEALKVLKQAGAEHVFNAGLVVAGHVGGMVEIGRDLDSNLETQIGNLHVCDGSLLSKDIRVTPTVTLVCLAKYLSKQLMKGI